MRIGVRCSSRALCQVLRTALAAHLVDDLPSRTNYSVREAEVDGKFHLLYRGGVVVVRTLDRARLVRGLLTHLFGHGAPPAGLLRVDAVALVRDDAAVLAPTLLRRDLARIERRLAQRGFAVLDAPFAHVDPEQAELVVPPLPPSVDLVPLDALGPRETSPRREAVVEPGRYPLASWAFPTTEETGPLTRAGAVQLALTSSIAPLAAEPPAVLYRLGQLFGKVPVDRVPLDPPEDVAAALHAIAGRR
ncbi:MAG TPA: hypothetical protein VGR26_01835 [Acidimicrobiales bacterium]|nr:hypothetical protein [Acidimicrobiales bacterium]